MIRAVIFDVGGVITKEFPGFKILAGKLGIDYNLIVKVWNENEIKIHEHKMPIENFLNIVKEKAKITTDIVAAWEKIYFETMNVDVDVLRIIKKLKDKYKLIIISNAAEFHARQIRRKGVYSHFDNVFLSYAVGIAKPQKGIFAHALKELQLTADECVFIDNDEKNIAAANALGFKTINFKNAEQLTGELKKLGVSV